MRSGPWVRAQHGLHPKSGNHTNRAVTMKNHQTAPIILLLILVLGATGANGQSLYAPYDFVTVAGSGYIGSVNGIGLGASFGAPYGITADSLGNLYVADSSNHLIRKIAPGLVVTTFAGSTTSGSIDGSSTNARFNFPVSVSVGTQGNLYVADTANHTIRQITPAGVVTTLAGSPGRSGSADGVGLAAQFYLPRGVAADAAGNIFVADYGNETIRKIAPAGDVSTLAGLANTPGSIDGIGNDSRFKDPDSIAVDSAGNIYVADQGNHTIRKITPAGLVTTIAGQAGSSGSADGVGALARFNAPAGLVVDNSGSIFVADSRNGTIRKITPDGMVTTLGGVAGTTSDGGTTGVVGYAADGAGSAARFRIPTGLTLDSSNNLYVADSWGPTISIGRPVNYTPYRFTTIAGNPGFGSSDGIGNEALFNGPWGIAVDGADNVYVTDYYNFTVRKITPRGVVTTLAGMAGVAARSSAFNSITSGLDADGTGNTARFGYFFDYGFFGTFTYGPQGIAADSAGNLLLADTPNRTIRKITPAGVVTTVAGSSGNYGTADGQGSLARLGDPSFVAIDVAGNAYVTDSASQLIRKITPAGLVTTLAGMASSAGSADGTNSTARFNYPSGIAVASSGNIYVADSGNNTIRKITRAGVVTTLAGLAGLSGSSDGVGKTARFNHPSGLAVDTAENVYVADQYNNLIRKVSASSVVTTLAGNTNYGNADGLGSAAGFSGPTAVAVDSSGNVYVTDQYNNTLRKVTPWGLVTTLAGFAGGGYGSADGPAARALFSNPTAVAADRSGNVYVADTGNNTIRQITADGMVTTLAGLAGNSGTDDGTNSVARFDAPYALTVDLAGVVYVADTYNNAIRKITPGGVVTTLAGLAGTSGSTDGTGSAARFNEPNGIAVDGASNVYVADTYNNTIRKVTPDGNVTTIAGLAGTYGTSDGLGNLARFSSPASLAVDGAGNLYVTDVDYSTIRKITPAGMVTTLAGCISCPYGSMDGVGGNASFDHPTGIAADAEGNLFVSEYYGFTIRKVSPTGVVTTIAGLARAFGSSDGTGSAARFGGSFFNGFFYYTQGPNGLAIDNAGNLYLADGINNIIRKGVAENFAPFIHSASTGHGAHSGQFGFILDAPIGTSAIVEASTDLAFWQPILTNVFNGPLDFNDPQSSLFTRRFYRARTP